MHDHVHNTGGASGSVADFVYRLFDTDFMQRGECVSWRPEIVGLHVVSDALIALAYYSIPVALIYFVRRRRSLAFNGIFIMFAAFILACGTTHVMGVLAFWWPLYRLDGVIKAVTALLSIGTAIALWKLMPQALALPSPTELRAFNENLEREISVRQRAEGELRTAQAELEERVRERTRELELLNARLTAEVNERRKVESELRISEERYRLAIKTAPLTVFNQDRELRYTWMDNPHIQGDPAQIIGKTDHELFDRAAAERLDELKKRVLVEGGSVQAEIEIGPGDEARTFEFRAEPIRNGGGLVTGITGVKYDITERKQAERHRQFLLAELDHRVKNNLATVLALAEESLRASDNLEDFRYAFLGRVRAMARTHTALARAKWEGVSLNELANLTLAPHLQGNPPRVSISGEPVLLSSKAASAMCMILNELATNAAKYGALSAGAAKGGQPTTGDPSAGRVELSWARQAPDAAGAPESLLVRWAESGGPPVSPPKRRGLGTELIEGGANYELGGSVTLDYQPTGLLCTLLFPLTPQNTRQGRFEVVALQPGSAPKGPR